MDFLFTKDKTREFELKDEMFDEMSKYTADLVSDDWSSNNPDHLLDSIFSMNVDLLGNLDATLDDLSDHIKSEAEQYELSASLQSEYLHNGTIPHCSISSSSSDSGLSSDNLDVEMSPDYEPLSPAISSPGPSISERGDNDSVKKCDSIENTFIENKVNKNQNFTKINNNNTNPEIKPKVIVQKMPQAFSISSNVIPPQQHTVNIGKGKDIKIVKISPHLLNSGNNKKVTIQLKNSQTGAKIEANAGSTVFLNKEGGQVQKFFRVQNTSNPRSILLPVSIQNVRDLGNIKIINATTLKKQNYSNKNKIELSPMKKTKQVPIKTTHTIIPKEEYIEDIMSEHNSDVESLAYEEIYSEESEVSEGTNYHLDGCYDSDMPNPKLVLTLEEKRLLAKEGITLPSHYPLTKHEERELKRIRRKIRNKISAQDSRKRKKEYVDGLEERVKQCTEENQTLLKRIKLLQNQNHNLMSQMKKLQTILSKGTNKTAQPATCLMVLILSLALVAAPNLKLGQNSKEIELAEAVQDTILQNRRNLLFDINEQQKIGNELFDDEINMDENAILNEDSIENDFIEKYSNCFNVRNNGKTSSLQSMLCKRPRTLVDFDVDDQNWYQNPKCSKSSFSSSQNMNLINGKDQEQPTQEKTPEIFNNMAKMYQEQLKTTQTSGFNIKPSIHSSLVGDIGVRSGGGDVQEFLLDKDIIEMVSKNSNGVYELNIENEDLYTMSAGGVLNNNHHETYINNYPDKKLNISELRNT